MSKQNIYNSGHNWTQKAAETEGSSSRPPAERIRIGGPDGININFLKPFLLFLIFFTAFLLTFLYLTAVGTSQLCVYRVKIEEEKKASYKKKETYTKIEAVGTGKNI